MCGSSYIAQVLPVLTIITKQQANNTSTSLVARLDFHRKAAQKMVFRYGHGTWLPKRFSMRPDTQPILCWGTRAPERNRLLTVANGQGAWLPIADG